MDDLPTARGSLRPLSFRSLPQKRLMHHDSMASIADLPGPFALRSGETIVRDRVASPLNSSSLTESKTGFALPESVLKPSRKTEGPQHYIDSASTASTATGCGLARAGHCSASCSQSNDSHVDNSIRSLSSSLASVSNTEDAIPTFMLPSTLYDASERSSFQ